MAWRHEPPDVETWCAEIAAEIGLIQNCLDYITHLSPILFRYSIVLVFWYQTKIAKNKLRVHWAEICVMPEGGQTQIERPDTETDGDCEMKLFDVWNSTLAPIGSILCIFKGLKTLFWSIHASYLTWYHPYNKQEQTPLSVSSGLNPFNCFVFRNQRFTKKHRYNTKIHLSGIFT